MAKRWWWHSERKQCNTYLHTYLQELELLLLILCCRFHCWIVKTNHQKNHNTISFITLTSLLSSSLQGTKIARRRIRRRSKETNPKTNRLFWFVFGKKNTDRSTTRFQHDWRSIPLPSRLKFFTNSYPARVCVARWTNAPEAAAAAATRSVAHRMCAILYVFFTFYIFVRIFVCVWVDMVCGLPIGLGDFGRIVLESINRKMINSLHGNIFWIIFWIH